MDDHGAPLHRRCRRFARSRRRSPQPLWRSLGLHLRLGHGLFKSIRFGHGLTPLAHGRLQLELVLGPEEARGRQSRCARPRCRQRKSTPPRVRRSLLTWLFQAELTCQPFQTEPACLMPPDPPVVPLLPNGTQPEALTGLGAHATLPLAYHCPPMDHSPTPSQAQVLLRPGFCADPPPSYRCQVWSEMVLPSPPPSLQATDHSPKPSRAQALMRRRQLRPHPRKHQAALDQQYPRSRSLARPATGRLVSEQAAALLSPAQIDRAHKILAGRFWHRLEQM